MDKLIINNKQIEAINEDNLEVSFGKPTIKHSITFIVEKDSEADLALRKFVKNKDEYKLSINIEEKKNAGQI
jgi:hypothetical protein